MEHRYADDSEPSWQTRSDRHTRSRYAGPDDPEVSGSYALDDPYDSGVRRVPEQRLDPLTATGGFSRPEPEARAAHGAARIPVRGPEYPAVRPTAATASAPPVPAQPVNAVRPTAATSAPPIPAQPVNPFEQVSAPTGTESFAQPTGLIPPVAPDRARPGQSRPADGVYRTGRPVAAVVLAIIAAVLLLPALRLLLDATFAADPSARGIVPAALLTLGLPLTGIGLFAGGAGREAWLRPPAIYLPAGLILLLAAGLAVA